MVEFAILTEKPSAMKNFAKALGGTLGNFEGHSYKIVASHGHLLQWNEPDLMVDPSLQEKYKSWSLQSIPWNERDFKWAKVPVNSYNPRTKKKGTTREDIKRIKETVIDADKIVIATDVDPSGEGEMIGWEIINAISWRKPVMRIYHADESENSIQKAFRNMKDITTQQKDGDFLKADVRSKWDFLSMQLTRIATVVAKNNGVNFVANQGRLKSVIIHFVYDQEQAIKNYVKKPFFEIRFKDENNHVFKVSDEARRVLFATQEEASAELGNFTISHISNVEKTQKRQAPPKLLDLSGLSSILAPKGIGPGVVKDTYQLMYDDGILSYPRTEDKFITEEQFNEMLPLVDRIADLVGADKDLLTHRVPRKTHIKNGGAHGANRPGLKVPGNLDELSKYGPAAKEIYMTLAKSFLAMFGEDYVYNQVTASLVEYPDYNTSFNMPVALNYKGIFDDSDDEESKDESSFELGSLANPFVNEGVNPKPQKPTMKWLDQKLKKYNVGTGATRTTTLSDLTKRQLSEKRGVLETTDEGKVIAVLAKDTWIADVKITETLFNSMDKVGRFELAPNQVIATVTQLVNHDKDIIVRNGQHLSALGIKSPEPKNFVQKDKATVQFKGKDVLISVEWGGHKFTEDELATLSAGDEISFTSGKGYEVSGKLAEQTFKGHKFVGFLKNK